VNARRTAATLALIALLDLSSAATAASPASKARHPVALAVSREGDRLFVANLRSGSLSVVDPRAKAVLSEHDLGRGLSDVALLPDGVHLVVVDKAAGKLLLVAWRDGKARVVDRQDVGDEPSSVVVRPGGASCVVAVTGSRRLFAVAITPPGKDRDEPSLKTAWVCELPFSPRSLAFVDDGKRLVAADAYGGNLAVLDPETGTDPAVKAIRAHNIRGLAVAPDGRTLAVAHQILHRLARTTFEDVHWGSLLSNHLRLLPVDSLLSRGDPLRGSRLIDLGGTGDAAGDPSAVAFGRGGALAVALGGVDEVAIGPRPGAALNRVGVGRGPAAVVPAPGGEAWYTADAFDDTVTVLDGPTGVFRATIRLGPRPEPDAIQRGERLFHDARLSHDGWMSCHSCHTDGRSNGQLADTLGDGSFGAPKRVPPLLGVGATAPWGWLGTFERLEDQVRKSVESTMQGKPLIDAQVADMTAFLRSLALPRPSATASPDDEAVARGREVFRARECAECHAPPEYTSPGRFDVGLADEVGNRKFNPPSLRGIGGREPLLHDGRAERLGDVFRRVKHPNGAAYTDAEVNDLTAFLRTL
jgi:DNA-binding beta-propeller fold protein YncE